MARAVRRAGTSPSSASPAAAAARRSRRRRCAPRSPSSAARGRSPAPRPSRARRRAPPRARAPRSPTRSTRGRSPSGSRCVDSTSARPRLARRAPHAVEQRRRARVARRVGALAPSEHERGRSRSDASKRHARARRRARRASPRGSARRGGCRRPRACPSTWRARCSGGRRRRPRSWRRLALDCPAARALSGATARREPLEALGLPCGEHRVGHGAATARARRRSRRRPRR